jgi:hypothetical protein
VVLIIPLRSVLTTYMPIPWIGLAAGSGAGTIRANKRSPWGRWHAWAWRLFGVPCSRMVIFQNVHWGLGLSGAAQSTPWPGALAACCPLTPARPWSFGWWILSDRDAFCLAEDSSWSAPKLPKDLFALGVHPLLGHG